MKNEKGSILPMMIAIVFITSYLLLALATQIETRYASFARTRAYMTLNILELEGLEQLSIILDEMGEIEDFIKVISLRDGQMMSIIMSTDGNYFDFEYEIWYNGFVRSRNLSVSREN